MNAKQYLNQIRKLDRMIQNKQEEIDTLRAICTSISVATDSERVQSSGSGDKIGNNVAKIVDLEDEILHMKQEFIMKRSEIIKKIELIEDASIYQTIYDRYVLMWQWEEIANDMNYTRQWVTELHRRGLHEIQGILTGQNTCF